MARKLAAAALPRPLFVAPAAPSGWRDKKIADQRRRFTTISAKTPIDAAFREAFGAAAA